MVSSVAGMTQSRRNKLCLWVVGILCRLWNDTARLACREILPKLLEGELDGGLVVGAGQRGEGPPQAWETGGGLVSEPLGNRARCQGAM